MNNIMEYKDYEFDGKIYHCRIIEGKDGEELVIGSMSFLEALQREDFEDENERFVSKEAERLYDEVFYFTDVVELQLDDEQMIELLKLDNPEWFD